MTTNKRIAYAVPAALLWAPFWLIAGLATGEVMIGVAIAAAPLIIGAIGLLIISYRHSAPPARVYLGIGIFLLVVVALATDWGPPPEY